MNINIDTKNQPKIGLVILTYNRPELLKQTLNSLLESNLENVAICFIDDGSTNRAVNKIIIKFKKNNNNVIYYRIKYNIKYQFKRKIKNNNPVIGYNIKRGFKALLKEFEKIEYLTNLDSDCLVKKDWLSVLVKTYKELRQKFNKNPSIILSGYRSPRKLIIKDYKKYESIIFVAGINIFVDIASFKSLLFKDFDIRYYPWDLTISINSILNTNKSLDSIFQLKKGVIQHIGYKDGIHGENTKKNYDVDRAFSYK